MRPAARCVRQPEIVAARGRRASAVAVRSTESSDVRVRRCSKLDPLWESSSPPSRRASVALLVERRRQAWTRSDVRLRGRFASAVWPAIRCLAGGLDAGPVTGATPRPETVDAPRALPSPRSAAGPERRCGSARTAAAHGAETDSTLVKAAGARVPLEADARNRGVRYHAELASAEGSRAAPNMKRASCGSRCVAPRSSKRNPRREGSQREMDAERLRGGRAGGVAALQPAC